MYKSNTKAEIKPSQNLIMKKKLVGKLKNPKNFLGQKEQSSFQLSNTTQSTKVQSNYRTRVNMKSQEILNPSKALNISNFHNKTINSSIGPDFDQSVVNIKTLRMLDSQRRSVDQAPIPGLTQSARQPPASFNTNILVDPSFVNQFNPGPNSARKPNRDKTVKKQKKSI